MIYLTKQVKFNILRVLLLLITCLMGVQSVYGQQEDSSAKQQTEYDYNNLDFEQISDSLGLGAPSLSIKQQDSLYRARRDSLRRDSIAKAASVLVTTYSIRKRKYVPLPDGITLTFSDSASIKAEHFLAIEEYFTTTFKKTAKKTILSVIAGPRNYQTTAFVRALPLLQAEYEEKKQTKFISDAELYTFKEKQMEYFDAVVDVVLDIKSEFIFVTELDTSSFSIQLLIDELTVKPIKTKLLPLNSYITEFIPWYQRRVILSFPRYYKGEDIWFERTIALTIQLMKADLLPDSKYQSIFRFDLNHDLKIDPKKVLNDINTN